MAEISLERLAQVIFRKPFSLLHYNIFLRPLIRFSQFAALTDEGKIKYLADSLLFLTADGKGQSPALTCFQTAHPVFWRLSSSHNIRTCAVDAWFHLKLRERKRSSRDSNTMASLWRR